MNLNCKILILILVLLSAFSLITKASLNDTIMDPLLMNSMKTANQLNPQFMALENNYQASLEQIAQLASFADPVLTFGVFLKPMTLMKGKQVFDLKIMQMFPWFGTRRLQQNRAEYQSGMEWQQYILGKNEVFSQIYNQWYALCVLKQEKINAQQQLVLLKQLENLAISKYSNSKGSMSDVLRIQIQEQAQKSRQLSLENELKLGIMRFNILLSKESTSPLLLPDSIALINYALKDDSVLNQLQNNPQIKLLKQQRMALEAQKQVNNKLSYPQLGVGVDYMGGNRIMPMVSTSLPIFRHKYKAQNKQYELLLSSNQHQYDAEMHQLQIRFLQSKQKKDDAQFHLNLYKQQRELATTTYKLLLQEFSAGTVPLSELISESQELLNYQIQSATAVADYNKECMNIYFLLNLFITKYPQLYE